MHFDITMMRSNKRIKLTSAARLLCAALAAYARR
jgi:hypothetical protein